MSAGKSVNFQDTLEGQREEKIYDQFLNQYQLVPDQNDIIPITRYTLQYIFHPAFPDDRDTRETFQHGILIPEEAAIQQGLGAGENVVAMPPAVFDEALRGIRKPFDTIQMELISSDTQPPILPDPEPFFTTTAPDGSVMGFYTYYGATGNHQAYQVIEALREDNDKLPHLQKYRLITPRDMLVIMSYNLNPQIAKEME